MQKLRAILISEWNNMKSWSGMHLHYTLKKSVDLFCLSPKDLRKAKLKKKIVDWLAL